MEKVGVPLNAAPPGFLEPVNTLLFTGGWVVAIGIGKAGVTY